ncbi:MAG: alpha-L-arabinofuranosidase [Bryobacterales bacterium]|nr:alpha-L-arabinofuranosidase [Bryobacterales bacterium]
MDLRRRDLLGGAAAPFAPASAIVVDPAPLFEISPHLYMQFMEPLGVTDGSVEAAWDYDADDWRKDFVEAARELNPGVIRWGGIYSQYYKWREGVGPPEKRPWMRNYVWGGKETNRVGTREFVDLCRRAGAEPLYCVNFLGEGEERYRKTREGSRWGDAREAADWVSYANDPDDRERKRHGHAEPYGIKLWQIGNETSYGVNRFTKEQAISHTIEFARAMKQRDPSIRIAGWGDRGREGGLWAGDMLKRAGEHLDYIAIHMMGQAPRRPDTVLTGWKYQRVPERAWEELIELADRVETRVAELEQVVRPYAPRIGIAITEGHLSLPPHNANPLLHEWLSAVYHARTMNIYQRHGKLVRIATGADFEGTRWTVNALMLQVPGRTTYFMPVASIMRLFKRHNGRQGVAVKSSPAELDVAASRTGNRVFLHVANMSYSRSIRAAFSVEGRRIAGGRAFEIAPEDPREFVGPTQPEVFKPRERAVPAGTAEWSFPPASVSAVELDLL